MEFSTGRLEPSSRIQERPFDSSAERSKPRTARRRKPELPDGEDEILRGEETADHQLDDLA